MYHIYHAVYFRDSNNSKFLAEGLIPPNIGNDIVANNVQFSLLSETLLVVKHYILRQMPTGIIPACLFLNLWPLMTFTSQVFSNMDQFSVYKPSLAVTLMMIAVHPAAITLTSVRVATKQVPRIHMKLFHTNLYSVVHILQTMLHITLQKWQIDLVIGSDLVNRDKHSRSTSVAFCVISFVFGASCDFL